MMLKEIFAPVVDFVYPPRCPLCGSRLAEQAGLCPECWSRLAIPGKPSCAKCQRPFDSSLPDEMVCAPCLADPPRHDGIFAATLYNEASRSLVLGFKHGRRIALARPIGRLVASRLAELDGEWLAIPVPLHRRRLWQRGFNQSALIAREMCRHTGNRLLVDGLIRRKATPTLGGLGRKARMRTLSGAIAANPRRSMLLKGARVILVDDVMTSGATSSACVSALKRAGAGAVVIACFARVLDEALDHTA